MNNLNKFRKSTVAILTALLIISIAAPLLSFAVAASTASISLSVATGPNGTPVTITGSGFKAGSALAFTIDGSSVANYGWEGTTPTATVTVAGTFSVATNIGQRTTDTPAGPLVLGIHTISVSDSAGNTATAQFQVVPPTISVTPATGTAGTTVVITGSGFSTVAGVTITSAKWTWTTNLGATVTNTIAIATGVTATSTPTTLSTDAVTSTGGYVGTVTLASSAAVQTGETTLTLTDSQGNVATYTFTVPTASNGGASIALSAASGTQGSAVIVTGAGFAPLSTVTLSATGWTLGATRPATITTTAAGTFSAVFNVPTGVVAKAYSVKATDGANNVATASFTVSPSVQVELGTYNAGTSTWTGSGTNTAPASAITNLGMKITIAGAAKGDVTPVAASVSFSSNLATVTPTSLVVASGGTTTGYTGLNFGLTSATGAAVVYLNFAATTLPVGSYTVTVTIGGVTYTQSFSGVTGPYTAVKTYQPIASTTLSAPIGSTVTFVYFGAAAATGSAVVTLDSTTLSSTKTTTATTYPVAGASVTITIPSTSVGLHTLSINDGTNTMSVILTVTSGVSATLYPTTAASGSTVTIIGSGFKQLAASGTSTPVATFNGATLTLTGAVDDTGLLVASFVVPSSTAGSYGLIIADGATIPYISTPATLTVPAAPTIVLSKTSGNLTGTLFSITGSGFLGSSDLVLTWDGADMTSTGVFATGLVSGTAGKAQSTPAGGISLLTTTALSTWGLTGAAAVAGPHTITISDGKNTASATYTITPEIALSSSAGKAGSIISISGRGFTGTTTGAVNKLVVTFNGAAATWVSSLGLAVDATTVVSTTSGEFAAATYYIKIPATQAAGTYTITVSDSVSPANTASITYTVLPTVGATISPTSGPTGATITLSGEGYTPGGTISAKFNGVTQTPAGTTTVRNTATDAGQIAVTSTSLGTTAPTITVPSTVLPGTYNVVVTDGVNSVTVQYTVIATAISLSAPSVAPGNKVNVTGTGFLSSLSTGTATLSGATGTTALTATPITGATVAANGTWMAEITVPQRATGTYTLTVSDGVHTATTQLSVVPKVTFTAASGLKGTTVTMNAAGFAAGTALTATFGTTAVTLAGATTGAAGGATEGQVTGATFTVPLTAAINTSTVTVTDGVSTTSATFNVTTPTLQISGVTSGPVGTAVQLIGTGYTASTIFVQVNGQLVATTPAVSGSSFVTYVTIPSTTAAGVAQITAADTLNNAATVEFTVTSGSTGSALPDQTTMTTTAKTTTTSGTATTTFTAGSTVKAGFTLQTASGSRDVVVAVTFQQGAKVYNMASFQTTMTTTPSAVSFSNLIPAGATGTWTAQLQVFAADGVTALAVQTLTFTVA